MTADEAKQALKEGGMRYNAKHGKSRSKEYYIWGEMKKRCTNKNHKDYKYYGGKGVNVCERWLKSFESFYEDMGDCPEGMSLDRFPDKNGDYGPGNCRWTTALNQNLNRRIYNKLGFTGVKKNGNKFQANIKYNNKIHYIGTFKTPELASLAFEACKSVLYTSREQ